MDGIILSDLRFDIVLRIQQLNRYIQIVAGSSEKTLYTSCKYMESPAILLKSAAYESNPTIRTDKVVKACRIITDILPYDKDSQSLIDEPELMKYLMVTLPLNPRAIDLIITTMIDKFKRVTVFLKETWQGFLQIASMEEENNSPRKKDNDPWKVLQLGIRSLIKLKSTTTMKDLDDMTPSMRQQKYNDVITGKKAVLKETVLDYVDKFLMIYIKELKEVTSFKPNISELTKKFTTFSVSENVVKKTYALIDKVKAIDPDLITEPEPEAGPSSRKDTLSRLGTSLSNFGEEPKDTKSKVGSLSKVGSEQTTTPVPSKPIISLKGKSLLQKIIEKKQKGSLEEVEEDDKSSDENKTEGEEDDDDDDEDDSGLNGNENDIGSPELEQWMAEYKISDAPIIYRSEFAKEFIQEETNFDILFSYLFDPRRTSISECWKIKHPNMSSVVVEDKDKPVPATPVHKEALGIFKLKDYKQLHPYVLRSYKVMQLFCDDRNYRDMIQAFPLVIGRFFQELHRNMTTKTDLMCNLNHIVAVIEYFVIKEPKLCVSYILHHNLVYKFFQNTELSSTQRLILLLFNCALNNQELEKDLQWKVLEYCRITSLFVDASSVILNGTNTFPLDKFKVEYKPPGITNVVDLANESLEPHDFKISKSNSVEDKTNSRLVEETKGFIIDIDDIKGFLQQPKNIDKKELISKNDSFVRTASKLNIKRYPSLMQKNFYENSISGSESYRSALGVQTERTVLPPLENTAMSKRNSQAKVDPSDFGLETLSNKNKVLAVDIPASNIKKLAQTATPTKKPSALPLLPLKNIHSVSPATTKNQSTPGKPVAVRINVTQSAGKEPIFLGAKKADTERIREKVLESGKVAQPKVVIPDTPEPIAKQKAAAAVSQTKLNSERSEYAPPEKKNLLREFDLDVLGKAELEHLNELYPTSTRNMVLTPLDKEAKKPEYKMKYIQANDQFALSLCELFNTLFQKMLMNAKTLLPLAIPACVHVDDELKQIYFKKRKLGYLPVDHGTFWKAVFVDQCTFVKNLLQNYLIKIKIHHFEEMNSGYVSGMIINSLLSNCSTNEFIKPYGKIIQNICRDNFLFLCKTLIQSYAWINRPELKVYLQDYEVNEPLGSGRIILAKTLDLIIQNDAENSFTIISQINDTCWSTLITWFLNKKSNNLYHQTFYSIMENTLLYTNEKTVLTILFKLNLLSSLYKIWNEIYQNGVLLKEKHVESMYYYLKRFTELIDQITKKHENYSVFISQLACSVSWSSLKAKFLTKPKVKKVTDKSKQKPRLPGVPSRVPSRAGSRVDIPGTASSMTRSRILADYSSQKGIDSPRGEKRIPTKERLF